MDKDPQWQILADPQHWFKVHLLYLFKFEFKIFCIAESFNTNNFSEFTALEHKFKR